MNTKQIISIFLLCGFLTTNLSCQNVKKEQTNDKEYLKGLTKASESDLSDQDIMLDGESIPVYNIDGKRIRGMEMMEAIMSGKYSQDYYVDKNKEIKAMVLVTAKEDEKMVWEEIKKQGDGNSELIGKDAIPFSVKDINGNEHSLNNLKGKIIVMNFWFVECKPCIIEIPELNELVKKYESKEVVFLGFATNDTSTLNSFLKEMDFLYKIIPNSKEIAADYEVLGYPTHVVIDQNSKIAFLTSGLKPTTIQDIENTIENLIKQ